MDTVEDVMIFDWDFHYFFLLFVYIEQAAAL